MKGHNWGLCRKCGEEHVGTKGIPRGPCSEETKRKISLKLKGVPKSEEHKRKNSLAKRGIPSKLRGIPRTEETKRKISSKQKGVPRKPHSEETKREMSILRKDWHQTHKHPLEGKLHSEETKDKIRKGRLLRIIPIKDTKIEKLFQQELEKRGIPFGKHVNLLNRYQVDLLLDRNIVIECDGDYWHNYPFGLEKDKRRDEKLCNAGFRVIRFWGNEIINDLDRCSDYVESLLWSR